MTQNPDNLNSSLPASVKSILGQPISNPSQTTDLSALFAMFAYKKEGQYFLNQTVYIDDYTFAKCRFDNCKLVTYKGTFKFDHCVVDASTVMFYGGEALKIVKLFNSKSPFANSFPNFLVQFNDDGTFSLE